ncbi:MAG: TIGR02679 family protein [Actinomycetota bacterium]|nr:TIGR02679 family protein [Actinomycetota bacterium]
MTGLAQRPELRRLWSAAHARLEQTGGRLDGARAVVHDPSPDERQAIDRLLGRRSRGRSVRVALDELDALLRDRAGTSLGAVVTAACGPLRDRLGEREAAADADQRLWADAAGHPAVTRHPQLAAWFDRLRSTGRLRRLDDPARRLGEALDVAAQLPSPEPIGRARLAASVLGESHALDDHTPAGRLVLAALAHLASVDEASLTAADRRRLWAGHGVVLDETSSTALTLGLRPLDNGPLTGAARRWADGGVALPLPLAAVIAEPWRVAPGTVVSVCENATVLEAAAARLGAACPPLVCVEGVPSVAARTLLASLAEGGARLRYHGDFGSGGIAIGNLVIGGLAAEPWRFDTAAHAAALAVTCAGGAPRRPVAGRVPPACWDAELAPSIERCGVEVEEEHVLDALLADLAELGR